MKKLNIAHKDIKPDNIILADNYKDFKIADFGVSQDFSVDKKDKSLCGTYRYMAPEQLIIRGFRKKEGQIFIDKIKLIT